MSLRVYVETSVFGYLTSRNSTSVIGAARQLSTRQWWERRSEFDLYVSEVVLRESRVGDEQAVAKRELALTGIPSLALTQEAASIAKMLLTEKVMPIKAAEDALHIAIAAVHRMDFLLSWNFRHIANPVIQAHIAARLHKMGLSLPFICPPDGLLGVVDADDASSWRINDD